MRPTSGIAAEDSLYIFGSSLVIPVEEHNRMMERLLASISHRLEKASQTRLMLCGLNLNMALDLIRIAEKFGASFVTDDFTHNARYGSNRISEEGDPFEALARGYLLKIPAPGMYPFEDRAREIQNRMKAAGAKGMVYLLQLYCDAYAFEYALLKERFDRWNLRHLKIEAEDTPSSLEQLNVRIQSFIESLL